MFDGTAKYDGEKEIDSGPSWPREQSVNVATICFIRSASLEKLLLTPLIFPLIFEFYPSPILPTMPIDEVLYRDLEQDGEAKVREMLALKTWADPRRIGLVKEWLRIQEETRSNAEAALREEASERREAREEETLAIAKDALAAAKAASLAATAAASLASDANEVARSNARTARSAKVAAWIAAIAAIAAIIVPMLFKK